MYFLLSPAKNLNETRDFTPKMYSEPPLLEEAELLMNDLRPLAPQQLAELMHISDKLALLNAERNANWQPPFTPEMPNKPFICLMVMCMKALMLITEMKMKSVIYIIMFVFYRVYTVCCVRWI